jgi:hypothetical protein
MAKGKLSSRRFHRALVAQTYAHSRREIDAAHRDIDIAKCVDP